MDNLSKYQALIPNVDEGLILTLEELQQQKIMNVIKLYHQFDSFPEDLNAILIELTVYRFNILGSEGLEQENKLGLDVYNTQYENDLLEKCEMYAIQFSDLENDRWRIQFL